MIFNISSDVRLTFPKKPIYEQRGKRIYLIGDLIGAYFENKKYGIKDSLSFLTDNLENRDRIISFLRESIGQFDLIIEHSNRIEVISSPSSSGLFYINNMDEIIFSKNEKELYILTKQKLNELEVINMVLSHHGLRTPFTTFIEDVKRMIGGQVLTIDKDNRITSHFYFIHDPVPL